jgi:hypothetical protein
MSAINTCDGLRQISRVGELEKDTAGQGQVRRTGFPADQIAVPDDFGTMGSKEIGEPFGAGK